MDRFGRMPLNDCLTRDNAEICSSSHSMTETSEWGTGNEHFPSGPGGVMGDGRWGSKASLLSSVVFAGLGIGGPMSLLLKDFSSFRAGGLVRG